MIRLSKACVCLIIMLGLSVASGLAQSGDTDSAQAPPTGQPPLIPESNLDDTVEIDVLEFKNIDIMDMLKVVSEKSGVNIIAGSGVSGRATVYLKNVKLKDALKTILDSNNLAYYIDDGIIHVMTAADFEGRYGHKFGGDIYTRIIPLMHAQAKDVTPLLEKMKSRFGSITSDLKSNTLILMDLVSNLDTMESLLQQIDVSVQTQVFALNYVQAKDMAEKVQEMLTPYAGQSRYDERSNRLIISDTPSRIAAIAQVIESFDVQEQQVLIEAKIVQVVLSKENKFGIDWEAIVSKYHNLDLVSNFDILKSSDKGGRLNIGTLASDDYTVLLEALKTAGATNILSSPSITALNKQEAKILVGSTQPYVTTTTTTPASGPVTTSESINFIDVGVKLYVTPTIHKDRFVTMQIKPEVSTVTSVLTTGSNNTIPVVDTSEAETTVRVKDGATIVIGGLIKEEKIDTENKIPILGDVPLLGMAFRSSDKFARKTEIVIFLTPKIITGDVDDSERFMALKKEP